MYQKPTVARLGTFRQLTQTGCVGTTDLTSIPGATSIGSTPIGAGTVCFAPNQSR